MRSARTAQPLRRRSPHLRRYFEPAAPAPPSGQCTITNAGNTNSVITTSGSSPATVTFPNALTPGSVLIVTVTAWDQNQGGIATPTDTGSHTWHAVAAERSIGVQPEVRMRTWWAANASSASSVQISASVSSVNVGNNWYFVCISEWNGVDLVTTVIDETGNNQAATSAAPATVAMDPGTEDACLFYGFAVWQGAGAADDNLAAVGPATELAHSDDWANSVTGGAAYVIASLSDTTDTAIGWTLATSRQWAADGFALLPAQTCGAAAFSPPYRRKHRMVPISAKKRMS
jgi:hypothetical protein